MSSFSRHTLTARTLMDGIDTSTRHRIALALKQLGSEDSAAEHIFAQWYSASSNAGKRICQGKKFVAGQYVPQILVVGGYTNEAGRVFVAGPVAVRRGFMIMRPLEMKAD